MYNQFLNSHLNKILGAGCGQKKKTACADYTRMEDTSVKAEYSEIHSPISYSIAGTVGGLISVTVGHPLDTIKVRLQTTAILAQRTKFRGTLDCISQTVRKEGALALFKGLSPHLLLSVPVASLTFWGYGMGLKLQSKDQNFDALTPLEIFNAGLFSGTCVAAVVVPFYLVKCRLQVQQMSSANVKYKGPATLAFHIFQTRGIRGLYRGLSANLLTAPATGCYFVSYEYLTRALTPAGTSRDDVGSLQVLVAGGVAGTIWWLVGLPADVLASRIWTAPEGKYPRGVRDALRELLRNEGAVALYKGLVPVLLRAAPEGAALFWGYEVTLKAINWMSRVFSPSDE